VIVIPFGMTSRNFLQIVVGDKEDSGAGFLRIANQKIYMQDKLGRFLKQIFDIFKMA
jgi:hypothetical protein